METYLKLLDLCHFELGEAFKGLKDENVWKRPAPNLLSVGEITGHIAYWEALGLAGEGEDLAKCRVKSLLLDPRFRYYSSNLETQPSEEQMRMTAEQVHNELVRIHEESVAHFRALSPGLSSALPGHSGKATYRSMLEYRVFHIAYHTGQIYSARHLLGEETVDN